MLIMFLLLEGPNNVNGQTLQSITQGKLLGDTQIIVGSRPTDIQINLLTNKIYVANKASNTVSVIDNNNGNTKTIPVGLEPQSIAIDSTRNKIYVANEADNTVSVIDGISDTKMKDIPVGPGPSAIIWKEFGSNTYVANGRSDTVSVINDTTDNRG